MLKGSKRKLSSGTSRQDSFKTVRVAILGQDGVGKSALTVRFLTKRFIGEYDSTLDVSLEGLISLIQKSIPGKSKIARKFCFKKVLKGKNDWEFLIGVLPTESTYKFDFEIDKELILLDILDTAGKNTDTKLDNLVDCWDLFVVLYAVTDRKTFDEAVRIARYIKQSRFLDSTAMALVGTKKDLVHLRQVEESEAKMLSERINCAFYEISISDSYNDTFTMFKNALRDYFRTNNSSPRESTMNLTAPKSKDKEKRAKSKVNKVLKTSFRRKNTVSVQT